MRRPNIRARCRRGGPSPAQHATAAGWLGDCVEGTGLTAVLHKWDGNEGECRRLLESEQWDSKSLRYQPGAATLTDDFQSAFRLMRRIGPDGEVTRADYYTWPLFKSVRKEQGLHEVMEHLFSKPIFSDTSET